MHLSNPQMIIPEVGVVDNANYIFSQPTDPDKFLSMSEQQQIK